MMCILQHGLINMIQGKTSGIPNIVVGVSDDGGGPKKGPNRAGLEQYL